MYKIGDFYSEKIVATDEIICEIAKVSGDINPIHLDENYAKGTIFGRRIAHGLFCLNAVSKLIGNNLPGRGSILLSQTFQYKKPVYIDDEVEVIIRIADIRFEKNIYILEVCCKNQNGEVVLMGESKVKWEGKV